MSRKSRIKSSKKNGFNLDDLSSLKSQNAMVGILSKNKGVVITVGIVFLILVTEIILTFLMAFKII